MQNQSSTDQKQIDKAASVAAGRGVQPTGKTAEETPGISFDDATPPPLAVSWMDEVCNE